MRYDLHDWAFPVKRLLSQRWRIALLEKSEVIAKNHYLCSMNSRFEINKRKEYLEGLSAAFSVSLPDDFRSDLEELMADKEVSDATKETLRLWREIAAPFSNTLSYIVNNRFILEALPEIIDDDSCDHVTMLAEDVFDLLQRLNKSTAKAFVATVEGKTGCVESLYAALLEGDKKAFVHLLSDHQSDAKPLIRLCRCCWDDVRLGTTIKEDELDPYLDYMSDLPCEDDDDQALNQAVQQVRPSWRRLQESDDADFDRDFEQYFRDCRKFYEAHFRMCVHFYQDNHADFKPDERKLFDSILQRPDAQILLKESVPCDPSDAATDEEEPFTLPRDFFEWAHASMMPIEHLYVKKEVVRRGAATFMELINYLAENGYIEDRPAVKSLFAYRMTGRCRPQGTLPAITWRGKNGKSYELIFLIRYLSERGDYKKMRRFFQGPEWVKDRDSSYAIDADSKFKLKIKEFYPGSCPF